MSVKLPSVVVTVIVAVPADLPSTTPEASTVAIASSEEDHVTDLSVASAGATVAVSVIVSLTAIVSVLGATVTPVT